MSTYFGYHCKTCPQDDQHDAACDDYECEQNARSEYWIKSGEHILRSFALMRDAIKAVHDGDTTGYLIMEVMGYGSAPIRWLLAHHGHDIEIVDEYSRTYPIEEHDGIQERTV